MRPALKEYFTFNNREKRGLVVLTTLIVGLIVLMNTIHLLVPPQQYEFDTFKAQLAEFEAAQTQKEEERKKKYNYPKRNNTYAQANKRDSLPPPERFKFNPNNLPVADWMRLGLSKKQALAIHKYEAAGGSFRKPADVKRMYTVSDELYAELEPWIEIPQAPADRKPPSDLYASVNRGQTSGSDKLWSGKSNKPYKKWEPPVMELNSATADDLQKLRGIGAVLSARIVKWRDTRGGFQSIDQLLDVYGIKPEVLEQNRKYLTIIPVEPKKININTCTAEELQQHCHIRWKVVNAIIAYRGHHGDFKTLEGLRGCKLVTGEIFSKIAPLLTL